MSATGKHPAGARPAEIPPGTRLETDDEIRQAILARRQRAAGKPPPAVPGTAPAGDDAPAEVVRPERPAQRPPVAYLCILDDGKADGEWVRLRADRTVLGRSEGDVLIPHDGLISGRHAEIVRQRTDRGWRWALADLGSTNGTFVRIGNTILRPGSELLVGSGRYRFEAAVPEVPGPAQGGATRAWGGSPVANLVPSLVEVTPTGPGQRYPLASPELWIGRDPKACAVARPADPLVNARHARLSRDADGGWRVENNQSLNGLWLRFDQPLPMGSACQFRLGEQRFVFKVTK